MKRQIKYSNETQDALCIWVEDPRMLHLDNRQDLLIGRFSDINKTVYRGVIKNEVYDIIKDTEKLSNWTTSKDVALDFMVPTGTLGGHRILLETFCEKGLDINATLDESDFSKAVVHEKGIILGVPSDYKTISEETKIHEYEGVKLEYTHMIVKIVKN